MSDGRTHPVGATSDDVSGLFQPNLKDKPARDAVELEAVDRAYQKHVYRARRKTKPEWLTSEFIQRVHLDMFGEIWDWAGKYRLTNTNIGVDFYRIREEVNNLCGDFACWNSKESSMPPVEIAARLQSRLTWIHPFTNGNGRHARLMTDIYFKSVKERLPQWPQIQLMSQGDKIRERYIRAMRAADQGDYSGLMRFISECQGP